MKYHGNPVAFPEIESGYTEEAAKREAARCYRCDAEYREVPVNSHHKGYDPHVAERYAEKKTIRRMR